MTMANETNIKTDLDKSVRLNRNRLGPLVENDYPIACLTVVAVSVAVQQQKVLGHNGVQEGGS
jgi:hypothetical protein